jgi:cysteinyl-tRNA synthetase
MAMKELGETLDIHCGGVDNIFPHHENEIAQSESVTSKPFARMWVHGEHLLIQGEKMAKSRGNFYTLRDLLDKGFSAQAIRYLLLSVQYRKQLNFTMDGLMQAQHSLDRIRDFVFRLQTAKLPGGTSPELTQAIATARNQFEAGLDDDLNTPQALGAVFNLIRACNIALDRDQLHEDDRASVLAWLAEVDTRLAIIPGAEDVGAKDDEVEALISGRNQARRNRNFAEADRLRQELLERGIVIEDTREGTKWRRK